MESSTAKRRASATTLRDSFESDVDSISLLDLKDQSRAQSEARDSKGKQRRWLNLTFMVLSFLPIIAILAFWVLISRNFLLNLEGLDLIPEKDFEKVLGLTDDDISGRQQVAIELHPQEHIYRKPGTISHNWTITSSIKAPDGVKKQVYLINGLFPGPTIETRSGDILEITVQNGLPGNEGVSIHWHGLCMKGVNHMDGAVGFTQDPIPADENFVYRFRVDGNQYGTFWYHAHSQAQRGDGLYGGLIIHKPASDAVSDKKRYAYEKDVLLMMGDWYHRRSEEVLAWYTSVRGFGNEPVPDSLVINDAGVFNCSNAVTARPIDCSPDQEGQMQPIFGEDLSPTRLRIVNVGSMAGISIGVSNANLTPLEVDGGFRISGPPVDKVGVLYPGERLDLLLQWEPEVKALGSVFVVELDSENFKYPNPALTPTQIFDSYPAPHINSQTEIKSLSIFDLQTAQPSLRDGQLIDLPSKASQTIILYTKTLKLSKYNNHPKGFMNQTSWSPQTPPLISQPRNTWDKNQFIPIITIPQNTNSIWVDIIINNLDDGSHPFHLHGHSFYVLASHRSTRGWGSFDTKKVIEYDVGKVLRKDTVVVPRRGHVVIRVEFDNFGVWMLHCHLLVHLGSGMAMGFEVVKGSI